MDTGLQKLPSIYRVEQAVGESERIYKIQVTVAQEISRSTKCFSAFHGTDTQGAFPKGFLDWLKKQGWAGNDDRFVETIHLCSGRITDKSSFTVDIRPEMEPDLIADATATGLPDCGYKYVIIDPPYSKDLAGKLYGTAEHYKSINAFVKEGVRLAKAGGLIVSLSYEYPRFRRVAI